MLFINHYVRTLPSTLILSIGKRFNITLEAETGYSYTKVRSILHYWNIYLKNISFWFEWEFEEICFSVLPQLMHFCIKPLNCGRLNISDSTFLDRSQSREFPAFNDGDDIAASRFCHTTNHSKHARGFFSVSNLYFTWVSLSV